MKIYHYHEANEQGYYVAAFNSWGSALRGQYLDERNAMRAWCKECFGPVRDVYDSRWKDDIMWGEVRFKSERDLTLFLLRWADE